MSHCNVIGQVVLKHFIFSVYIVKDVFYASSTAYLTTYDGERKGGGGYFCSKIFDAKIELREKKVFLSIQKMVRRV